MKSTTTFLLFVFSLMAYHANGQSIKAMTYNIRFDNPGDGVHSWTHRKDHVVDLVRFYEPDVLGVQEALHHQLKDLDETLDNMTYVGVGRDDGKEAGEYSAILYNEERFELIEASTFWLSPNPGEPSVGWDASMERICTYALLQERQPTNGTQRRFWVFNAHLDHRGPQSRLEALKLIWKTIQERNQPVNLSVILMGDFNATPEEAPITFLSKHLQDTRMENEHPYGPDGTWSTFERGKAPKRRIDYIFVNSEFSVRKYAAIADIYGDDYYPSDHLPVFVELYWK